MSGWPLVAIVAIIVWGAIQIARARAGITEDEYGNTTLAPREDQRSLAELDAARRELSDLRERVKVLERIATDANTGEAREQARIAAEIEALRAPTTGTPAMKEDKSE